MKRHLYSYLLAALSVVTAGSAVVASSAFREPDQDALPAPENVSGNLIDRGVFVRWESPVDCFNNIPVTESFEKYTAGVTPDLSPWTLIDADGVAAGTNFPGTTGMAGTKISYSLIENASAAHTGNQFLGGVYNGKRNDEWLISPELNGDAQTITFWAHGYGGYTETVKVMASSTDAAMASFTEVETFSIENTDWKRFSVNLAAGTKYFAIRYYSRDMYYIYLDDVTFIPASSRFQPAPKREPAAEDILGFNIYRDGVKLNDAPVAAISYVDPYPQPGDNSYTVTAVYTTGESAHSAPAIVNVPLSEVSMPAPTRFTAEEVDDAVNLSWKAPDLSYANVIPVTEDFSSFSAGGVNGDDLAPWLLVNGNGTDHNQGVQGTNPWYIVVDGDNHYLATSYAAKLDDWLISTRLNGYEQTISFRARSSHGSYPESFEVLYTTADERSVDAFTGNQLLTVPEVPDSWKDYTVTLPEGTTYFAIRCTSPDAYYFYVDDITYTPLELSQPSRVYTPLYGYNVYRDGLKLNAEPITETSYADASSRTPGEELVYTVTAVYAAGESEPAKASVVVYDPRPRPFNLQGSVVENGIKIQWDTYVDKYNSDPVTEGFEGYNHLEHSDLSPWTLVDGSGLGAGTDFPGTTWGNGEKFAYVVIDGTTQTEAGLKPHGGLKYIATIYKTGGANDDWLISPELYGGAQTVTFYLKAGHQLSETAEVLYSTTTDDTSAFTSIGTVTVGTTWTYITAPIPEGARYFAIRCISDDRYYMLVDDVTFIPAARHGLRTAPMREPYYEAADGFNIYREGVKLNDELIKFDSFVDTSVTELGEYTYTVTAVYGDYETPASRACTVVVDYSKLTYPAPIGLTTATNDQGLQINWSPVNVPWSSSVNNGPQRILSKLIGYNVYRDGVKLNDEPLRETTFLDVEDHLPATTTVYGVSAVYEGSESAISTLDFYTAPDPIPAGIYVYPIQAGLRIDWEPVTFPVLLGSPQRVRSHLGYNVFVNDTKVNDTPVTGNSFVYPEGGIGDWNVTVSAVFNNSESPKGEPYNLTIEPERVYLPAVSDFVADAQGLEISLGWTAPEPDIRPLPVVEDFESYPATTQPENKNALGPWTILNRNGAVHYRQAGLSWFVDKKVGRNGSKCLETTYGDRSLDDWLISTELPAIAQTISFWAACSEPMSPETISVLYSTTDNKPESFTEAYRTRVNKAEWTEYTVDLPEGTRFFAIRCTSPDAYFLYVDDITYSWACTLQGDVLGYNLYRNSGSSWELLNTEGLLTVPGFKENVSEGTHQYRLVTVYPWGESEPSELQIEATTTGISVIGVNAYDPEAVYYDLQGIRVDRSVPGQVYIVRRGHVATKQLLR